MTPTIIVFFDRLAHKNKVQIDAVHAMGYSMSFFVNEYNKSADAYLTEADNHVLLLPGFLNRFKQIYNFFKKYKNHCHHLEIYPAGRFAFIYLLMARLLFHFKVLSVERGDIQYLVNKKLSFFERFSMKTCYRYCHMVWYREPYMKLIFEKFKIKKLFFLHNSVEIPQLRSFEVVKDIDFLWVNRVITERKSGWFMNALKKDELRGTKNLLIGLTSVTNFEEDQQYVRANPVHNLKIMDYVADPTEYYKRAKFFVLPADIVFANNSLLEAMSYGVVPIISNVSGAPLIVENNVNGYLVAHNEDAFTQALIVANQLDENNYNRLSESARNKIKTDFSPEKYFQGLQKLYAFK